MRSAWIWLAAACGSPSPASAPVDARTDAGIDARPDADAPIAIERIYGVTIDDIEPLAEIVASLRDLPQRMTARLVFDEGVPASDYAESVAAIGAVSSIMGEILDSSYVPTLTVAQYRARTAEYLNAFGDAIAIWEIGNEINGEWVDPTGVADVVAKMTGAFDLVHAAGKRTALTLYGCDDADAAHHMLPWARTHVPQHMRDQLDYVFVSFYEGDCGVAPPNWQTTFEELRAIFPHAKLGFGEVGAVDRNGERIANSAIAGPYLRRYYDLAVDVPGYVGGHFWWYYVEDMLPHATSEMYAILADTIR